jgi:hypothetical protein
MMYRLKARIFSFEKGNHFQLFDPVPKVIVDFLKRVAIRAKLFDEVPRSK